MSRLGEFGARIERIRECRYMPWLRCGMRVEVNGKMGIVTGGNRSLNINVKFDGKNWSDNCHPWWETRYFDKSGNVIADYRSKVAQ